ncbi:MAG: UDP-N-acetylglucosamine acyltransferase [Myxococcota bacterium]|jgi:UDP-N-acetylglucosamine acyltransferase
MAHVHPSASVDPGARLSATTAVGPFSVIGPDVVLGDDVVVGAHVVVTGRTSIGARTEVHPFTSLGGPPQAQGADFADARLEIGTDNVIREHVSVHVGTTAGGNTTRIGDHNMIMNASHIGHDCTVGSHCVFASYSGLAGHAIVEDHAFLGAYTGVHQHARIGESVMTAANTKLSLDAPPFSMVAGDRARVVGVNKVGLKRRGFSSERQGHIKRAFHLLFHSDLRLAEALSTVREEHKVGSQGQVTEEQDVERLLLFLEASKRGFCRS